MAQKYGAEIKSTKAVNTLNKTQCMKIQFPKQRFRSPFVSPRRKLDLSKFLDVEKIRENAHRELKQIRANAEEYQNGRSGLDERE